MPKRSLDKEREEARRLFLTAEVETNAEIAHRLKVKPHTVAKWRREEDWEGLKLKIDRRAGEMFVEKIASDRVTLNIRHYKFWEVLVGNLAEYLKREKALDIRAMERIAGILDRAQKGQRLAKGLSTGGETEELIRAQSQAEIRKLIDVFIDAVKENVGDEESRERIRRAIITQLPTEESAGTGDAGDAVIE